MNRKTVAAAKIATVTKCFAILSFSLSFVIWLETMLKINLLQTALYLFTACAPL